MRLLSLFALTLCVAACSTTPDTKGILSEQGYYEAAQKSLKYGNFENASKHLEALESHYPVGVYTEQAQLDIIYARYKHLDYPGAVVAAERFIRLHPLNPQIDYAYYLRALANFEADKDAFLRFIPLNTAHRDLNSSRLAFDNFNELVRRFPNSAYAPDARQHMIYIRNQMAENELHAGRYYLKRKTYVAALNRARWVVENYPQTPQTPEALAMIVHCYQQLGMTDLANQQLALLKTNYPDYVDTQNQVKLDLGAQNEERSWLNMVSFNLLDKKLTTSPKTGDVPPPKAAQ
ncbi:outer membrane protein assembly factor BamD [Agitococcus lubricus]|uniref:Outer membrane protein assembly factor BamD n=1 Tax=Agitococcus lubricus TaxID=1077255 RepID=A0A2T5J196_9GAMM|nr:outer membrane protein assembly factor BamD [Agitococcus lubricus]PTQ90165.1 Beta-barrel assembly machine subunit BamD [Agitococcus lubricus]